MSCRRARSAQAHHRQQKQCKSPTVPNRARTVCRFHHLNLKVSTVTLRQPVFVKRRLLSAPADS
jgi:hypothetical protein